MHMCMWYAYTGRTVNYSPHVFDQSSKQWFHYCLTCSFIPEYTVILLLMDCIFLVIRSTNIGNRKEISNATLREL